MRLDLSADPWGAAMLGTAVVVVLGLVIGLLALAMRTSKRVAGWLCGLGSLAFLGTAAAGTLQRVQASDAAAQRAAQDAQKPEGKVLSAPPVPTADTSDAVDVAPGDSEDEGSGGTGGPTDEGATGGAETQGTPTAIAETGGEPPEADTDAAPEAVADPIPAVAPADFPTDPEAAAAEANARLRDAKRIVESEQDCRDAEKIQSTWLALSTIPPTLMRARVRSTARDVEGCRRRIVGGRQWKVRKDQVAARDDFPDEFTKRLAAEGIGVWSNVYGKDHEKLNAGSKQLTKAKIEELLTGGLRDELEGLGFVAVSMSDGKSVVRETFTPKTVDELVDAELEAFGLHEPLVLE
jgi:hypothetical protein